ncbi:MAG: NADH:ubiquinone reductase (Na(+)-transporting) subunit B [Kiritimatiellae bacterium]|jgi:Na+-transporting NADH:ubiquinone oxidoreductase subunit B|nr:NADH:ubiquinone reductase (Na(+)-transporting) subunit B [Kiritimatiellia bacterium]
MSDLKETIAKKHKEIEPLFHKGGKFEKLFPLFEAQDTFLLTPPDTTKGMTHVRDAVDLKRVMFTVVVALLPCLLWGMFNAGHQYYHYSGIEAGLFAKIFRGSWIVMPIVLTSYAVGGLWEVLFAVVRKHEINEGFLVTGMLFPLTLPPTIALWQVAVGISFGVVVGKEVFGGTGFNILNPALTARAYLFFAHAKDMTGEIWASAKDGATGATPLGLGAAFGGEGLNVSEELANRGHTFWSMFGGLEPGSIGETAAIPILLGAAILIVSGVGSWRIMAGGCVGLIGTAVLMNLMPTQGMAEGQVVQMTTWTQIPFTYHLVMGSFLFGIVFMATDPVSAASTNVGKWIYGVLIGVVTILVRVTNPGFPEGVMLAILFMNVMAPIIDYYVVQAHIKNRNANLRKFSYAKG